MLIVDRCDFLVFRFRHFHFRADKVYIRSQRVGYVSIRATPLPLCTQLRKLSENWSSQEWTPWGALVLYRRRQNSEMRKYFYEFFNNVNPALSVRFIDTAGQGEWEYCKGGGRGVIHAQINMKTLVFCGFSIKIHPKSHNNPPKVEFLCIFPSSHPNFPTVAIIHPTLSHRLSPGLRPSASARCRFSDYIRFRPSASARCRFCPLPLLPAAASRGLRPSASARCRFCPLPAAFENIRSTTRYSSDAPLRGLSGPMVYPSLGSDSVHPVCSSILGEDLSQNGSSDDQRSTAKKEEEGSKILLNWC